MCTLILNTELTISFLRSTAYPKAFVSLQHNSTNRTTTTSNCTRANEPDGIIGHENMKQRKLSLCHASLYEKIPWGNLMFRYLQVKGKLLKL